MSKIAVAPRRPSNRRLRRSLSAVRNVFRMRYVLPVLVIAGAVFVGSADRSGAYATAIQSFTHDIRVQGVNAGLKLRWVRVVGRDRTSKDAVRQLLETYRGQGLMEINLEDIRAELLAKPWVESVDIRRLLPNSLEVTINEREPLARFFNSEQYELVDLNGLVIPEQSLAEHDALPVIVGEHATRHAHDLMRTIDAYPSVNDVMIGAEWIGNRRWTLYLETPDSRKVRALLPETDVERALFQLENAISKDRLLERGIIAIDLRLPQVTARLMPEIAEQLLRRTP